MAYDEGLAERIREAFGSRQGVVEKKMFGGLAFMVDGHMCCGVVKDEMMLRLGPARYEAALAQEHVRLMDFTGRPMRGMVMVTAKGLEDDESLSDWIEQGLAFVATLPPR